MLSPERGGILLRGIRGAVSVSENSRTAILQACTVLVRRMMDENHLDPEEMVAVFFTLTDDLNAAFPAEAARAMGLDRVPLLCLREVAVPGAMASVLRILMLVNRDGPLNSVRHVYLGEARKLRQDLEEIRTP
jgi:chorismate mutase